MFAPWVHISIHPGHDRGGLAPFRAYCCGDVTYESLPYLNRNKVLVDSCNILLVTPKTKREERRSGTWSTFRYALNMEKSTIIFFPDGSIQSYFF